MTSKELTEVVTGEIVSLASEMKIINEAIRRADRASDAHLRAFEKAQITGEDAQQEVGNALIRIYRGELWREDGARSWSGWIKAGGAEAVGFAGGPAEVGRLIDNVSINAELATEESVKLLAKTGMANNSPLNVRQTRELKKVPKEQRPEVVERAAAAGRVTALAIKEAAEEVRAGAPRRGPDPKPSEVRTAAWKVDFLKALKIAVQASSPEEVLDYTREKLRV